jgi:hypothetical protein
LTPSGGWSLHRLYTEHSMNKDEHIGNTEIKTMLRFILETTAEIASLAMFGSAVAIWALVLSPIA